MLTTLARLAQPAKQVLQKEDIAVCVLQDSRVQCVKPVRTNGLAKIGLFGISRMPKRKEDNFYTVFVRFYFEAIKVALECK